MSPWNKERKERFEPFTSTASIELRRRRRTLICAVNQDAEKAFKKTVEVDRLIDMLREANPSELQKLVVENILAFNETFWIRLAARSDTCKSDDDKARFCFFLLQKDYEELATAVMSIVDRIVHKTHEKIDSATDVLKEILEPAVNEEEETPWPPKDPEALKTMEKKIFQMEQEGKLDEGFLAEVSAQLRQSVPVKETVMDISCSSILSLLVHQLMLNCLNLFISELTMYFSEVSMAKEDADKPGLEAMLQKVLQLYASTVLSKRSYAKKGNTLFIEFSMHHPLVTKAEQFLETVIKAPEQEWNKLLIDGLAVGKGEISAEDFYAVIKKRIERTLIRTSRGGCPVSSGQYGIVLLCNNECCSRSYGSIGELQAVLSPIDPLP
ncbi:hypothetical protein GOBAR_AA03087 [Gossypium barbadense]|uniref:Uncharacterized protein n=1 Tax=Gossypium barbadense TaxID=3634 RepID=A0A2P5YPF3_GOSBA|nr:hypothetical protein GOBAR_AA03087 [Gossypium barbadense]